MLPAESLGYSRWRCQATGVLDRWLPLLKRRHRTQLISCSALTKHCILPCGVFPAKKVYIKGCKKDYYMQQYVIKQPLVVSVVRV